ncbi:MAG: 8-amino-7-oxononanoate synthase [Acidobacteria bacterium]|nr:8-amino-7-oxononanoate synthase [Acidobacteriota bacterium]
MNDLLRELERELEKIRSQNLYRRLTDPKGLDFCSNDYLGLSRDPNFRAAILEKLEQATGLDSVSSPASRLLRGNTSRHQALEQRLSGFKGTEAALIFPTGYQTNIGVFTALVGSQDRVLSDAQNHASIIDGLRLSGCQKIVFPHLDLGAVEEALIQPHPEGKTFLVTESLFSMDGDVAPLETYAELAKNHEAYLIVDDAHAVGVFGEERGSGLTERFGVEKRALAIVSTFGKAFGLFGAFVAGPQVVIEYLINRCRSFIFTTAVPPLLLYGVEAGLDLLDAEPERRKRVCLLADRLRQRFKKAGLDTLQSAGPIVPVVLGKSERALAVAQCLQEKGLDVRAIRPPTVEPETARLRISVHADHTEQQIDQLAEAVEKAVNKIGKR